jgi:hypothetical protein
MSNDSLSVAPEFRALVEGSSAAALLEANLGGESLRPSDLTWVKIPTGGLTRWSWQTKSGAEFSEKAISGLLVVVGKTEQVLWPHADSTPGSRPILVSTDGRTAHKVGSDYGDLDPNVIESAKNADGSYDIRKIAYFQWQGRGPGSTPPRAKSSRVLGILRENEATPLFVRVSQTSLRSVDDLLRGITSEGLFHYRAVVELTLEKRKGKRADYAVLVAKKVGEVSVEAGEKAKRLFTEPLSEVVCPSAESRASRSGLGGGTVDADSVPF